MILDSGERTEYDTGAVRDCKEGKGRFDLMPLGIAVRWNHNEHTVFKDVITLLAELQKELMEDESHEVANLCDDIATRFIQNFFDSFPAAMLELAKHFEDGAKKYGEFNWQKGIPYASYFDSSCRHLMKLLAGWDDEPHNRAFLWNIMCLEWTWINSKEK